MQYFLSPPPDNSLLWLGRTAPANCDCWCTKWEHLFHEQGENRDLQAPYTAELFSGYYPGKKSNRTFQEHLKLIFFIWNNVICFCQRESFWAFTACLRVLQFWRPYPGKPGFCFNKDLIIHPEALGPTAAVPVYGYSMKNTFCCTRLSYCLLWVKLQV